MKHMLLSSFLLLSVAACAPPEGEFIPSTRSAVELRSIQSRVVRGDSVTVMRGIAGSMHDLGYRITRADADTGVISATRATALRVVFVVRPRSASESVVRANATVLIAGREGQVDSGEFYSRNLFEPLSQFMSREFVALPEGVAAPEAERPAAEINTAAQRVAAARAASARGQAGTAPNTPASPQAPPAARPVQ